MFLLQKLKFTVTFIKPFSTFGKCCSKYFYLNFRLIFPVYTICLYPDGNRRSYLLIQTCSIHGLLFSLWSFVATRVTVILRNLCNNCFQYQKSNCCISFRPMQAVFTSLLNSFYGLKT